MMKKLLLSFCAFIIAMGVMAEEYESLYFYAWDKSGAGEANNIELTTTDGDIYCATGNTFTNSSTNLSGIEIVNSGWTIEYKLASEAAVTKNEMLFFTLSGTEKGYVWGWTLAATDYIWFQKSTGKFIITDDSTNPFGGEVVHTVLNIYNPTTATFTPMTTTDGVLYTLTGFAADIYFSFRIATEDWKEEYYADNSHININVDGDELQMYAWSEDTKEYFCTQQAVPETATWWFRRDLKQMAITSDDSNPWNTMPKYVTAGKFYKLKNTEGNSLAYDGSSVDFAATPASGSDIWYFEENGGANWYKLNNYASGLYLNGDVMGAIGEASSNTFWKYESIYGIGGYKPSEEYAVFNNAISRIEPVESLPVEVKEIGYATLYTPVALWVNSDTKAYTGEVNGNVITLTKVQMIPANTAVLISATPGIYDFYIPTEAEIAANAPTIDSNCFTGAIDTRNIMAESVMALGCGLQSGIPGFYTYSGTTFHGYRAWIEKPATARALTFSVNEADAIKTALAEENSIQHVYDINGRRVMPIPQGIYFINGKKVIIK